MTCEESIKWLDSLIKTLGQSQYQSLWNWEQPLTEIKEMLESKRVVELPCKVGDTVYVLDYENDNAVDYSGYIFIMANNDFAFLSPVLNGESNPIEICNEYFQRSIDDEDNSGVIVPLTELFLTKSEAEQKLKELQNEM